MRWNDVTKEEIGYGMAILSLIFGFVMVIWSFITPPPGQVDTSIQWIFAQVLVFSGSIFGIYLHINSSIKSVESRLEKKLKDDFK